MPYIRVYKEIGISEDIESKEDLYEYDLSNINNKNPLEQLLCLSDDKDRNFCSLYGNGVHKIFVYWPSRKYLIRLFVPRLHLLPLIYTFVVADIRADIRREIIEQINV